MDQIGRIERIQYCPQKGQKTVLTEQGRISKCYGILGDYHGQTGNSGLTLWTMEARSTLEKEGFSGICFQKFQENLLVSGLDIGKLKQGDCLITGEIILEVQKIGKKCHPEACILGDKKHCLLKSQTVFLKPLSDGILHTGDEIKMEEKISG